MTISREKVGFIGQWWRTVDQPIFFAVFLIIFFGIVMVMAASPAVAERIGLSSSHFVGRQLAFTLLSVATMLFISFQSPVMVRRLGVLGCLVTIILLAALPVIGTEIKGAKSWIPLGVFSLQPTEFLKPFFIITTAWFLARKKYNKNFPGFFISTLLLVVVVGLVMLQPDVGMAALIIAVWGGQLFIAGLSKVWLTIAASGMIVAAFAAYSFVPHAAQRIDAFLNPATSDQYQISKSIAAFTEGGFFGKGPGEGKIKDSLPDAHTDFIFAVAGEELGAITCIIIASLYAFIVIRGFYKMLKQSDLFVAYSVCGLLIGFGLNALINMAVSLSLIPNTGMTLPFISYGGSSMLGTGVAMGMVLSLTRKRFGRV